MRLSLGLVVALGAAAMTLGRESRADLINNPTLCALVVPKLQQQFRSANFKRIQAEGVALHRRRLAALGAATRAFEEFAQSFNIHLRRIDPAQVESLVRNGAPSLARLGEYLILKNRHRAIQELGTFEGPSGQVLTFETRAGAWSVDSKWSAAVSACVVLKEPGADTVEGCLDVDPRILPPRNRHLTFTAEDIRARVRAAIPSPPHLYANEGDFIASKLEEAGLWCANYSLMSRNEPGTDGRLAEGSRAAGSRGAWGEGSRCGCCDPEAGIGI